GKATLQPLDIPPELYNLFTSQCQLGKMFRKNIRAYNTNFYFASMGVTLDKRYSGARDSRVYTFRVQGGIHHRIDQEIVTILSCVLAQNPYVQTFRSLGNLGLLDKYRVELTASVKDDQRLYNRPTTSERIPREGVDIRELVDDDDDGAEDDEEDYSLDCASVERVQNMVVTDISTILQSIGKSLSNFDLTNITMDVRSYPFGCREKNAYDTIMRHVDVDSPSVFFIDVPGGTGKTFLYKAFLATVRFRGLIALATASSGAAANNMTGERTGHSRFKISFNLTTNSICNIKKQSGLAKLLCQATLIIWDEESMAKRQAVEAVDRTMQDINGVKLPFGGKIMVLRGDFRQVLSVVRRGTRAQIVDSSLQMSPLWNIIKVIRLTINMRVRTDPWFSNFLLRVGDRVEEVIDEDYVRISDEMTIPYTNETALKDALTNEIFPSFATNAHSADDIVSRAILSTINEHVDSINVLLIDRFPGEEKVYYSFDEAEDDTHNYYPLEFLNSLNRDIMSTTKVLVKPQKEFDQEGVYTSNDVYQELLRDE
nr:hypothetical protein [Tanacetum cinerariifolium]